MNRLFQYYRQKAREKKKTGKSGAPPAGPAPARRSARTMPPSLRARVMLRDGGRCPPCEGRQAPGCGRSRFVEVHHIRAVGAGGAHDPAKSLVLCQAQVHEGRRGLPFNQKLTFSSFPVKVSRGGFLTRAGKLCIEMKMRPGTEFGRLKSAEPISRVRRSPR